MAFEIAGAAGERILFRLQRGDDALGRGEIFVRIEGAQLEASAIHIAHPIDREEDLGAHGVRRLLRRGLQARDGVVEPYAQRDRQRRGSERRRLIHQFGDEHVRAVGDVVEIELERKRRFAQVARDAVERSEILDQLRNLLRLIRRRRRGTLAKRHVRGERSLELDRRREDLLEPHRVRFRRIDDEAVGAQHDRMRVLDRVGPWTAVQQRQPFCVEPAQLAALAEARRFRNLRVERVDLRLQRALRFHGVLARHVPDAHRRQIGERLAERRRRCERDNQKGDEKKKTLFHRRECYYQGTCGER